MPLFGKAEMLNERADFYAKILRTNSTKSNWRLLSATTSWPAIAKGSNLLGLWRAFFKWSEGG